MTLCCVLGQDIGMGTGIVRETRFVMLGGSLRMDWHPIQWGVVIFLVASSHGGNRDKHWLDGTLGLTDFLLVKRLGLLLLFYRVTVCWYP